MGISHTGYNHSPDKVVHLGGAPSGGVPITAAGSGGGALLGLGGGRRGPPQEASLGEEQARPLITTGVWGGAAQRGGAWPALCAACLACSQLCGRLCIQLCRLSSPLPESACLAVPTTGPLPVPACICLSAADCGSPFILLQWRFPTPKPKRSGGVPFRARLHGPHAPRRRRPICARPTQLRAALHARRGAPDDGVNHIIMLCMPRVHVACAASGGLPSQPPRQPRCPADRSCCWTFLAQVLCLWEDSLVKGSTYKGYALSPADEAHLAAAAAPHDAVARALVAGAVPGEPPPGSLCVRMACCIGGVGWRGGRKGLCMLHGAAACVVQAAGAAWLQVGQHTTATSLPAENGYWFDPQAVGVRFEPLQVRGSPGGAWERAHGLCALWRQRFAGMA